MYCALSVRHVHQPEVFTCQATARLLSEHFVTVHSGANCIAVCRPPLAALKSLVIVAWWPVTERTQDKRPSHMNFNWPSSQFHLHATARLHSHPSAPEPCPFSWIAANFSVLGLEVITGKQFCQCVVLSPIERQCPCHPVFLVFPTSA